jgi:hypothetical protein
MTRQIAALLWKEAREARWFLFVGLLVFLVLPIIGGLQAMSTYRYSFQIDAVIAVLPLGGLLAIFIAVGATARDLQDSLLVFWRSRPVGTVRWLLIKYAVGLAALLLVCQLPLIVQAYLEDRQSWRLMEALLPAMLWAHPFVLMAVYSVAFLAGVLLRRVAQAAMVAIAAELLVYFLPYVVPPLSFATFPPMSREMLAAAHVIPLAGAMLGASLVCLALACIAVARDWRIEADRKITYWSIGLAALILIGLPAYHLGTNLPMLDQADFPTRPGIAPAVHRYGWSDYRDRWVDYITSSEAGHRAQVSTHGHAYTGIVDVQLTGDRLRVSPPVGDADYDVVFGDVPVQASGGSAYRYKLVSQRVVGSSATSPADWMQQLVVLDSDLSVVNRVDLAPHVDWVDWARGVRAIGKHAYAMGSKRRVDDPLKYGPRTLVFDLSDPAAPRLIEVRDGDAFGGSFWSAAGSGAGDWPQTATVFLPQFPELSNSERLELALSHRGNDERSRRKGDLLIVLHATDLAIYRLMSHTDSMATYQLTGLCRASPLERLMRPRGERLIYGGGSAIYAVGRGITAYDISDPSRPRVVGHFNVPIAGDRLQAAAMADGRLLVAADKLYLVGPPRGWSPK